MYVGKQGFTRGEMLKLVELYTLFFKGKNTE